MKQADFDGLAGELEILLAQGPGAEWPEGRFSALALRCAAVQLDGNPAYGAFCRARGITTDTLHRWQDIPPVPATAFKHLDLVTGPPDSVEAVYRTSGTTRGAEARGRHLVRRLGLYRASAVGNFAAHLLPEGRALPLLSLIPAPEEAPESSLSAMMGMVAEDLCTEVRWVVDGDGALDLDGFLHMARRDEPLLVAGTALALVHLLDAVGENGGVRLGEGTRLMETGGFKGRGGGVSRDDLYGRLHRVLGIGEDHVVNEYGMTELLSQLYEPVLVRGDATPRRHTPPPWLKVRALDPVTLEELPEGESGLLAFFDLANLGSVCHVLTEDLGSVSDDGVRLVGRAAGAEPRGCSRAMDDLMRAVGRAP